MRDLLGGKGADVAKMTRVLGPDRVPAGFTITTEACVAYMRAGRTEPDGLASEVADALARLETRAGKRLGDPADPLLGVCGEHGGDPDSIDFFYMAGLDYVSCSPFRVPIARLAAARAAISHSGDGEWSR
jgi:phosphoenolpyruvate synthase/pyruvate phosphate dikinase